MLRCEQVFNAGHRIRVTVACTGLPLYETGGNGTDEEAGRVEVRALAVFCVWESFLFAKAALVVPALGDGHSF